MSTDPTTPTTARDCHWESEAAWERYQERLGNLSTNEEAAIRRAFLSGYAEGEAERNAVQSNTAGGAKAW